MLSLKRRLGIVGSPDARSPLNVTIPPPPAAHVAVAVTPTGRVAVRVGVLATDVRVAVDTGLTLPQAPARIATSSTHQPVADTELSLASLKRINRFCPVKAANDTVVLTKLVPLGLPVQACLPAIG